MGITYHEASGCFKLDEGSTSYVIGIMGGEQYAMLLYYGPYVPDGDLRELYGPYYDFRPSVYPRDKARYILDSKQVLTVIENYSRALELLDDYNHQTMKRPK